MLPPRLVATVPTALLQRQMRFREIALVAFFTRIVGRILPTIVLAVSGFGVWALVAGYVIQAYLDAAMLLYLARPRVGWPSDWRCARDVWSFGGRFMAIQSVNQMALNIDNIVVGRLLGPAALGFYSRAFALMMLPVNLLGTSAQQVLFPRFSRLQNDRAGAAVGAVCRHRPGDRLDPAAGGVSRDRGRQPRAAGAGRDVDTSHPADANPVRDDRLPHRLQGHARPSRSPRPASRPH